jgi:3,4-dihydroxy 2-butanone 4-phosphate synthase/GTP cyclohydrolase II
MPLSPLSDIFADLRAGKMVILVDDEDRENEGDLVLPAQFASPQAITFMLSQAMGYLCLSLPGQDCDRLHLFPQASLNTSVRGTAFTVSIDLHPSHGGTTGVSAAERAKCIQMAIDQRTGASDFVRPGHINPLRARDGGVLVRAGQTEGSIDLCRLAGLTPAACIIEVMNPDGTMARMPDLEVFAKRHQLRICSVAQIIEHRLRQESLVRRVGTPRELRTPEGVFHAHVFQSRVDSLPHLALTMGLERASHDAPVAEPTLVRMHRRHLLGDVFGELATAPDGKSTSDVLRASMRLIAREGRGAVVYLRPSSLEGADADTSPSSPANTTMTDLEGRLQTFRTSTQAPDASDAPRLDRSIASANPSASAALAKAPPAMDLREYGVGGQILRDLGLRKLRLITTSTNDLPGLDAFDLHIVDRVKP